MLASRLVTMIEQRAEQVTKAVVNELRTDHRTSSYRNLDPQEDRSRVFEVVHNLGMWLDFKSDPSTEKAYRGLGQRRFHEGVPLAEVVCALMLTKQTIRRFIQTEGWMDSAVDICQQVELHTLIDRFFERAVYFTVLSYEAEARAAAAAAKQPHVTRRNLTSRWTLRKTAQPV
jgi:hypothetical protein